MLQTSVTSIKKQKQKLKEHSFPFHKGVNMNLPFHKGLNMFGETVT